TYTFTVTNTGNTDLTAVTVTEALRGVSAVTLSRGDEGDNILEDGEVWTYSATYGVTQADINAGTVENTATADSEQTEPVDDDETVDLPQNAGLSIDKEGTFAAGTDGVANVGDLITYTFTVTNTGNTDLTGVTV